MFEFLTRKKMKLQTEKIAVAVQQNRIYIMQLQKENEYFRKEMNKNGFKIGTREEYFQELMKKEEKEMNDKMNDKIAEIKANKKIAEDSKSK